MARLYNARGGGMWYNETKMKVGVCNIRFHSHSFFNYEEGE